jgi:hypothetical protein
VVRPEVYQPPAGLARIRGWPGHLSLVPSTLGVAVD